MNFLFSGLLPSSYSLFPYISYKYIVKRIMLLVVVAFAYGATATPAFSGDPNIASLASVTASSERTAQGQPATSAVDGFIDGWPGDATKEWSSFQEQAGAWIQLDWAGLYSVDRITLYDRPNTYDQITSATLSFSDGSTQVVSALDNAGGGVDIFLSPAVLTSSVRMTVNSTSPATVHIGLAEIEVFGTLFSGGNLPPTANAGADQIVAEGSIVNLTGTGTDPNGDALTYSWTQTVGSAVTLTGATTATPSFTAASGLTVAETLSFSLVVNDGSVDSSADLVNITVTPTLSGNPNIASLASVTASSERTAQGQPATSAVDGFIDGWPGDATKEWSSFQEQAGAWIQLDWAG
ncbi:MAG: discoidin domain-containing protein, partial [Thiohalomonadales bacterium]